MIFWEKFEFSGFFFEPENSQDGTLAVSGAGLLQIVHKANDLGFTIIGNGDEFSTFQSNDLVNLAACLKELSRTVVDDSDSFEKFIVECTQRQGLRKIAKIVIDSENMTCL